MDYRAALIVSFGGMNISKDSMTDLDHLLARTSRTFAVTIPMLPMPTRDEVGIAYLLFRIVDTFEDATRWSPEQRIDAIRAFVPLLADRRPGQARRFADRCLAHPPVEHEGYLELLEEIPFVLEQLDGLSELSRRLLVLHVGRSAEGMAEVLGRVGPEQDIELRSLAELRHYCYVVAGIVGEMLTELYLLNRPGLNVAADYLRERSRLFGEGLQLVNILKDVDTDEREGRIYIPHAQRADVFALAQSDLQAATEYTLAVQRAGADRGLIAFDALLVRLALGTLSAIRQRRPGGKLTRGEVVALVAAVLGDIDNGRPALPSAGSEAYDLAAE
jgi:farnesyl-diphosphate farnesyltransferase